MLAKQKGYLRGLRPSKESKERIIRLKGWPGITLPTRDYSLKEKGNSLYLLRDREEISFFLKGVAGDTVTNYASGYEAKLQKEKERREKTWRLKEYCETSMSSCEAANFYCDKCESSHKEWALERKRKGKKIVKPVKTGGLKEFFEERDALRKKVPFENKKKFVRGFLRTCFGKW